MNTLIGPALDSISRYEEMAGRLGSALSGCDEEIKVMLRRYLNACERLEDTLRQLVSSSRGGPALELEDITPIISSYDAAANKADSFVKNTERTALRDLVSELLEITENMEISVKALLVSLTTGPEDYRRDLSEENRPNI